MNYSIPALVKFYFCLLFFCIVFTGFSQTVGNTSFSNKFEEFDYYAKPDKKNKLSKYFREHINLNLLDAVKFRETAAYKRRIFLSFRLNRKNKVVGVKVNSLYSELNNSIIKAFRKYDIEALEIPEKNLLNTYVIQIISNGGDETIVNCSTHVVYDRLPVFKGCESITSFNNMKTCINKQLESHVVKHISPNEIKKSKAFGYISLHPRFLINEEGVVIKTKAKAPTENLTKELNRVVALFPKAIIPPMRNGKPTKYFFNGFTGLVIDSEDGKYEEEVLQSNDAIYSPNNELALHFKQHLSEEELNKITFFKKQKRVIVYFSLNKKGEIAEIKTNRKDPKLNSRIIHVFKQFPLEKLNLKFSNKLALYSYNIVTKGYPKNRIECNNKPNVTVFPFFNKRCEKSKTPSQLKKCFSNNVSKILKRDFNKYVAGKTKLTGIIKIYAKFQVDETGAIINVKVRAPNPYITNEIENILKSIPKAYKPGYYNGEPKAVGLSVPIRFTIGIKKPEDPFKNNRKYQF